MYIRSAAKSALHTEQLRLGVGPEGDVPLERFFQCFRHISILLRRVSFKTHTSPGLLPFY